MRQLPEVATAGPGGGDPVTGVELAGQPYDERGLLRPPAAATALSAIRADRKGAMIQYTTVEFHRGWNGVETFIRTLMKVGYIKPASTANSYAVLDVLDDNDDIIASYDLPTRNAFAYVYRKLRLRVVKPPPEATT